MHGFDGTAAYDDGAIDTNRSANPHLEDMIRARYSRRQTLSGGLSAMTAAVFGGMLLAGCDEEEREGTTATASGSANATSGQTVTLTGAVTSGTPINTNWQQLSGPPVTFANANALTTTLSRLR